MERSNEGRRSLAQLIARRQSDILIVACVAGGLTLTSMVMGSGAAMTFEALPTAEQVAASVAPESPTPIDGASASAVPAEVVADAIDTAVPVGDALVVAPEQPVVPAPVAQRGTGSADPVPVALMPASPVLARSGPTAAAPAPSPTVAAAPTNAPAAPTPVPTAAPTTAAPTTAAPTTPAPTVTAAPTTAPPAVAALTYSTHQSGSSGVVTLQSDGSAMYITSVAAQANWVFEVEKNGPRTVEIKFFNVVTKNEGEFHATLEGGRIKVEN